MPPHPGRNGGHLGGCIMLSAQEEDREEACAGDVGRPPCRGPVGGRVDRTGGGVWMDGWSTISESTNRASPRTQLVVRIELSWRYTSRNAQEEYKLNMRIFPPLLLFCTVQ